MSRPGRNTLVIVALCLLGVTGLALFIVRAAGPGPEYRAALEALERRDFPAASEHLDKHLEDHPKDLDALLLAARTARRRGATADFLKHIEAHQQAHGPDAPRVYEYRLLGA